MELVDQPQQSLPEPGTLVAWVEPGNPDLEFDARRARPTPGSFYGVATASPENGEAVEIHLDRRLRAG